MNRYLPASLIAVAITASSIEAFAQNTQNPDALVAAIEAHNTSAAQSQRTAEAERHHRAALRLWEQLPGTNDEERRVALHRSNPALAERATNAVALASFSLAEIAANAVEHFAIPPAPQGRITNAYLNQQVNNAFRQMYQRSEREARPAYQRAIALGANAIAARATRRLAELYQTVGQRFASTAVPEDFRAQQELADAFRREVDSFAEPLFETARGGFRRCIAMDQSAEHSEAAQCRVALDHSVRWQFLLGSELSRTEAMHRLLLLRQQQLNACISTPSQNQQLTLRFSLSADGVVSQPVVTGYPPNDMSIAGCVAATAQRWVFPSAPGTAAQTISIPIRFQGTSS